MNEHVENIIIGGGLAGGITSLILARQGFSGVLLEKGGQPYGANGSIRDENGHHFDIGGHWIYEGRSAFTSRFFRQVQDDEVRSFPIDRSIVLREHRIPYAAPLDEWPQSLRAMMDPNPEADRVTLGSTREAFAEAYGSEFADFLFDEVLASFPSLTWLRDQGEPEEKLMRWVFPWFVPLTDRERAPSSDGDRGFYIHESRSYHFEERYSDGPEYVLYPDGDGFGNWIEAIFRKGREAVDVQLNTDRIELNLDGGEPQVRAVRTEDGTYEPERVFWCAPVSVLCDQLGWSLPEKKRQIGVLGNFTFEEEVRATEHEIMFGDPDHDIRRVTQPARLAGQEPARTLQVELFFPDGTFDRSEEAWKESWLESLKELGIVEPDHTVTNFQFLSAPMGAVVDEAFQKALGTIREKVLNLSTNLHVPDVKQGPGNSSRSVPRIFHRVYRQLVRL